MKSSKPAATSKEAWETNPVSSFMMQFPGLEDVTDIKDLLSVESIGHADAEGGGLGGSGGAASPSSDVGDTSAADCGDAPATIFSPACDVVQVLEIQYPNRVYAVALTEDGGLFAISGTAKEVWVYSTRSFHLVQVLSTESTVHSLAFSLDGGSLAAGGADKFVFVWECHDFKPTFALQRGREVHCVAFSNDSLGFAVGHKAVVYGGGDEHQLSWQGRPNFEVMSEVLESPRALSVILGNFPSVANICSAHTGESVLQRVVRLHTNNVLRSLLAADRHVGYLHDKTGHSALIMALVLEKRRSAQVSSTLTLLISMCLRNQAGPPNSQLRTHICFFRCSSPL